MILNLDFTSDVPIYSQIKEQIIKSIAQSLSGKRQFYGVSLNSDYFTKKEFKALDKKFKLLVTIGFVVFTIITLICIYIFKAYITSSIVPVLGFCLYEFFAFLHVHNKVKALKEDLSLEISDLELEKTKVILDTDFINEKNRIIKKYSLLYMIPFAITVMIAKVLLLLTSSIKFKFCSVIFYHPLF